jgi:hypothetical protein
MKRKLLFLIASTLILPVASMPSIAATASDALGVTAVPSIPAPAAIVPTPSAQPQPPAIATQAPATVTSCSAGGCLDSGGNQYIGGAAGNVYLNSGGKPCARTGIWMQCS